MRPPRKYRRKVKAALRHFPYWRFVGVLRDACQFKPSRDHTKTAHHRSAFKSVMKRSIFKWELDAGRTVLE
jgi:hypothetical protein